MAAGDLRLVLSQVAPFNRETLQRSQEKRGNHRCQNDHSHDRRKSARRDQAFLNSLRSIKKTLLKIRCLQDFLKPQQLFDALAEVDRAATLLG